eukprot:scaffold1426_cov263-Pinguiococcus_pyrenoidosus.AAC.4
MGKVGQLTVPRRKPAYLLWAAFARVRTTQNCLRWPLPWLSSARLRHQAPPGSWRRRRAGLMEFCRSLSTFKEEVGCIQAHTRNTQNRTTHINAKTHVGPKYLAQREELTASDGPADSPSPSFSLLLSLYVSVSSQEPQGGGRSLLLDESSDSMLLDSDDNMEDEEQELMEKVSELHLAMTAVSNPEAFPDEAAPSAQSAQSAQSRGMGNARLVALPARARKTTMSRRVARALVNASGSASPMDGLGKQSVNQRGQPRRLRPKSLAQTSQQRVPMAVLKLPEDHNGGVDRQDSFMLGRKLLKPRRSKGRVVFASEQSPLANADQSQNENGTPAKRAPAPVASLSTARREAQPETVTVCPFPGGVAGQQLPPSRGEASNLNRVTLVIATLALLSLPLHAALLYWGGANLFHGVQRHEREDAMAHLDVHALQRKQCHGSPSPYESMACEAGLPTPLTLEQLHQLCDSDSSTPATMLECNDALLAYRQAQLAWNGTVAGPGGLRGSGKAGFPQRGDLTHADAGPSGGQGEPSVAGREASWWRPWSRRDGTPFERRSEDDFLDSEEHASRSGSWLNDLKDRLLHSVERLEEQRRRRHRSREESFSQMQNFRSDLSYF